MSGLRAQSVGENRLDGGDGGFIIFGHFGAFSEGGRFVIFGHFGRFRRAVGFLLSAILAVFGGR